MKILITGGAGFVGSHLALQFKKNYPEFQVTCLDNLKRRGSELNLTRLANAGINFVHGDIRNKEDLFTLEPFDVLIDASAEPSVMAGITSPVEQVVNNNLLGTVNCLELAKKHKAAFIFLSTSRIYPIKLIEEINFTEGKTRFEISEDQTMPGITAAGLSEEFPISGSRSFYGTTKLASELLIQEYNALAGLKTIVNRCGVLTGPWQMGKADQGVVVLWVARHFWKKKLSYVGYGGEGKQVRDILHVNDLYDLVDHQIHHVDELNGQTFNVGGGQEISVSLHELTRLCEEVTGNKIEIEPVPETRTADIRVYITDNSKITNTTGWKPKVQPKQIIQEVYDWIKENEKSLEKILN